jgi:putative ABC transport system ATP-binding protein
MNGTADRSPRAAPPTPRGRPAVQEAPPVVDLRGITKRYRVGSVPVEALRGLDLVVRRGEMVAVMGPSGSGKSTLMHIMGCLDRPTGGAYLLEGGDVGGLDEVALAEVRNRRIGFVFQSFNLLSSLPAWRNVELPLVYASTPRARRRRLAMEALEAVGIAGRAEHRPGQLSGGEQQRVALARAIVTGPSLILADEPTGNLDSRATQDVLGLFTSLNAEGRTVVLITHEDEVADHCPRVVRIADGVVVADEGGRA